MELFQLVVTESVYLLDGYCFSFLQVDSRINTWSVGWYCRFFFFFKYIQQVMIFSWNRVPDLLVFVIFFILYRQLCADVDSFQLNFVVDFVLS